MRAVRTAPLGSGRGRRGWGVVPLLSASPAESKQARLRHAVKSLLSGSEGGDRHRPAVITLRTYAHLFPGDEDRTRNVPDAALSPLEDSVRTDAAPSL